MGCGPCGNTFDSPQQFLDFVYKLPPLLSQEITVMQPTRKRLYMKMPERGELPTQVGTNYQKLKVHTPRFRDFRNGEIYHSREDRTHGTSANGGANAMCTVGPFHKLNGLGYERVGIEHRRAFFETCDFCVESLWRENIAPEEFFSEYMRGVREQLDDIMDRTHRNEYESRAQKVWAIYTTAGNLLQNVQNPFTWAPILTGQISLPSVEMLYQFAEDNLSSYSDYYAVGEVEGEPIYPLVMNARTKHNLVFKNKQFIEFIKFSSMADNLIDLWQGPISRVGPFVIYVDNDSTRLKRDSVTGLVSEIPHWVPIPAPDGGEMWVEHPEWHSRGPLYYDTIMIPRRDIWKKLIRKIPTSIGGVQFGEEISPELELTYINIKDKKCNPFGWIGHFIASHEYYVEPGDNVAEAPCYMIGVFSGIPGASGEMLYEEQPACPIVIIPCNLVDSTGCPCNGVKCVTVNPTVPWQMFVTFTETFTPAKVAGDTIVLKTNNGGTATVTVSTPLSVSADGLTILVDVSAADMLNGPIDPTDYVEVACEVVEYCEAQVIGMDDCRSEISNAVRIRLDRNIKCRTVGDDILLTFKSGRFTFDIVAANTATQWYTVRYAAGNGPTDDPEGDTPASDTWNVCCDRGMPSHVCCVPTVGNACQSCDPVFTKCDGGTVTGLPTGGGCNTCDASAPIIVPEEE